MEGAFDFAALGIGGVSVAALVFGIVEVLKLFGVKDVGTRIAALVVGFVLTGIAYALSQGMIPEVAVPWITLVVVALAGAVAAMGFYGFVDKRTTRRDE